MVTTVIPASLMVSWQPPLEINHNGMITGYVINYTKVDSNVTTSVKVTDGTTHTLSGLVPLVNYSVVMAALNVNGTGSFSIPVVGMSGLLGKLNMNKTCTSYVHIGNSYCINVYVNQPLQYRIAKFINGGNVD